MGIEAVYSLADAVADLQPQGLIRDVLLYRAPRWARVEPGSVTADLGFSGAGLDSRNVAAGSLFVGLAGEHGDGRDYVGAALRAGADVALTRPWEAGGADPLLSGEPGKEAAVLISPDPAAALATLAAAWRRRRDVPTVGVTGSNGKTTTKDMLAALLATLGETHATAGNFNNDLGLPLTLLGLRESHRWAVLEMGASAPGDIDRLAAAARPHVGVITNAAGAHLEGFGDLDTVVAAKGELLDHLPADGVAVLNRDSYGYEAWAERARCPVHSWGCGEGDNRWRWLGGPGLGRLELDGEVLEAPLPGRHNAANLVSAVVAARALSGRDLDIAGALSHLHSSPHRSRLLQVAGVTILDDTYNANPASVVAAATALCELESAGRRLAVLGVMAELGDDSEARHFETGRDVISAGVDGVWTLGASAEALALGAREAGGEGRCFASVEDLVSALDRELEPGDLVLFKGSRSAAMERVLDGYRARKDPDPTQWKKT